MSYIKHHLSALVLILAVFSVFILPTCCLGADYTDGKLRKNDFKFMNLTLFANLKTETDNNNSYFEFEGGGRSGVLDLYYFVDINGSFNDRRNGDFFMKLKPRLSLDAMFKKDYSNKVIKELFFSMYYKGGNNWNQQRFGFGAKLNFPGASNFDVNFYRNFESQIGNPDGYVFTTSWAFPIREYKNGQKFSYTAWSDWDFDQDTGDNFAMKNSLKYDFDDYAIVIGYFFNSNKDTSSDIGFQLKF